jgi:hypothetical protein
MVTRNFSCKWALEPLLLSAGGRVTRRQTLQTRPGMGLFESLDKTLRCVVLTILLSATIGVMHHFWHHRNDLFFVRMPDGNLQDTIAIGDISISVCSVQAISCSESC